MQIASIDSDCKCFLDFEFRESNNWTELQRREHYSKAVSACDVSAAATAWREWLLSFLPGEVARRAIPSLQLLDEMGQH
jgi:hypothetical protein